MSSQILITGGAGFVGSSLAIDWKQRHRDDRVIAFDNLKRRGSELNLPRLAQAGVEFRHGDVRAAGDLEWIDRLDVLIECSAEPSVMAGRDGQPRYVVDTNLGGCVNCLEIARRTGAVFVFLSTSRVYPTATISALNYHVRDQRFELDEVQPVAGASARGITENFPLDGARTLYGATKLACELLITEYADMFGLRAVINRCGVLSGPWQMGYAEQGILAHWMLAHAFRRPLAYIGYGGEGRQVRDILHVADLADLIHRQLNTANQLRGDIFNVGGGLANGVSLAELTALCSTVTGVRLDVGARPETRPGDVPIYITDHSKVTERFDWRPVRTVRDICADVFGWIEANAAGLRGAL